MKNKYVLRSRISEAKFRHLVRCFALDLDARQASALTGLNRNKVNRYYLLIRQRIAELCERESPFSGEIEVDESYFGGKRIKGKRGRGAFGKTPVFEFHEGKVYTRSCRIARSHAEAISGAESTRTASFIPMGRAITASSISATRSTTVQHGQNEFARAAATQRIESFWSFAKRTADEVPWRPWRNLLLTSGLRVQVHYREQAHASPQTSREFAVQLK